MRYFLFPLFLFSFVGANTFTRDGAYKYVFNQTSETIYNTLWKDLDGDGRDDLMIGVSCSESEECYYYCFKNSKSGFLFLGEILLQRALFRLLNEKDHGIYHILYYSKKSLEIGKLLRYKYNGKNFQIDSISNETQNSSLSP